MEKTNVLGKLIREYRVHAGLTQLELALKIGYNNSIFLSQMENGRSKIPLNVLGLLAHQLEIPEDKLLNLMIDKFIKEAKGIFKTERLSFHNSHSKQSSKSDSLHKDKNKKIYSTRDVNKIINTIKNEDARRIRNLIKENEELKKNI